MNPRGFLFGLGIVALLIAGAFFVRNDYDTVLALINSTAQPVAAAVFLSR
jgi:hypothetical protein